MIPVFEAAEDLRRCLESVVRWTDLARHRVLLVLDGPQTAAVETVLAECATSHPNRIVTIRNPEHRGFARTVNAGMSFSENDVVLLNSDTVVTRGWVDKLAAAAASSGDIATVTPLSNNATLCSVPRTFEQNLLPDGFDLDAFAALVEQVSSRAYPRIPTAVGFCMYIRRAAIEDVGLFDDVTFAGGYGEENEFCLRALARGWVHVCDDATFILHEGHRSFGATRASRQKAAARQLRRLHPRYDATITAFRERDPMAPIAARIVAALADPTAGSSPRRLRVVHLVHGWPPFQHAGTELYAYWLASSQRNSHHVAVYTRMAEPAREEAHVVERYDHGIRVRFLVNNFTTRNPLRRNALANPVLDRDFERFLREERPDLLHVHHLAGHAFSLMRVARRMKIPIVLQIQDWWALCARVQLLDRQGRRCTGPGEEKCAACATLTRVPPAALTNRGLHMIRRRAARAAVRAADAYVAGSQAIRRDYARLVRPGTPFHVLPYGIAMEPVPRQPRVHTRPVRFGYVGSIAPHKGVHLAMEAIRQFDPKDATLRIFGDSSAFPEYVRSMGQAPNVTFAGAFREEDKPSVFSQIDVLLVPSIGLESFGLAPREAMASGVPVIAAEGAALSEMFAPGTCGELFPAEDVQALRAIMERVVADPAILDRWSAALPPSKRATDHAAEIEAVYRDVLERTRS